MKQKRSSVSISSEGESLRNKDSSGSRASLPHSITDSTEDWETQVLLASLLGIRATDDLGTCFLLSSQTRFDIVRRIAGLDLPYSIAC